jgi:hypothetical protein
VTTTTTIPPPSTGPNQPAPQRRSSGPPPPEDSDESYDEDDEDEDEMEIEVDECAECTEEGCVANRQRTSPYCLRHSIDFLFMNCMDLGEEKYGVWVDMLPGLEPNSWRQMVLLIDCYLHSSVNISYWDQREVIQVHVG